VVGCVVIALLITFAVVAIVASIGNNNGAPAPQPRVTAR
jgi:hypothetical protein